MLILRNVNNCFMYRIDEIKTKIDMYLQKNVCFLFLRNSILVHIFTKTNTI
jgi:hypothetical protein